MLPGVEMMACPNLAVAPEVMHHVVRVESSYNPYAIGVVGGRLVRQPKNLAEAVSTVEMLEDKGFNFSLGLAQVNRYNLKKYGLNTYQNAFDKCPNLQAGSKILAECYNRLGDWGKAFSCYYSGNSVTGFRHGYVQKIYASMRRDLPMSPLASGRAAPIPVIGSPRKSAAAASSASAVATAAVFNTQGRTTSRKSSLLQRRIVTDTTSSQSHFIANEEIAARTPVSVPANTAAGRLTPEEALIQRAAAAQGSAIAQPVLPASAETVSNRDSAFVF